MTNTTLPTTPHTPHVPAVTNETPASTPHSEDLASVPIWSAVSRTQPARVLEGDVQTDVAIVGGGIVGLMTARLCRQAGLRVVLVEAKHIGHGESSRTTAHVTAQLDARWRKVVDDVGADTAGLLWREAMSSMDLLDTVIRELGVECSWRRLPAWLFTESERGLFALREEARMATTAGIPCRMVEGDAVQADTRLPWRTRGAVRFDAQAQLDPGPLLAALAADLERQGCAIYEDSPALEVHEDPDPVVTTALGSVHAQHVVVATHAPFNNRLLLQTKIAHYRSYVVALRGAGDMPEGLFWDDADPYHYVRTFDSGGTRTVLVGGEDHRTGQDDDTNLRIEALVEWARTRLPGYTVERRWSGQIIEPVDGLPYIGRNSLERNVYEATGFSGTGWAYGVLAARMLVDAIQGRVHPLADTLAATRVTPMASVKRYIQENVAFPWHFFGDRLSAESTHVASLAPGTGKIFMTRTMRKVAVYRDVDGVFHALSPVCPHMGCIVDFNALESSWDCPCHGSRFDVHGALLNGPATEGLAALDPSELRLEQA